MTRSIRQIEHIESPFATMTNLHKDCNIMPKKVDHPRDIDINKKTSKVASGALSIS
jgi:hypothetical protein